MYGIPPYVHPFTSLFQYQLTSQVASAPQAPSAPQVPYASEGSYIGTPQSDLMFSRDNQSMFSHGLMTMQAIMVQLTQSGNDLFAQMNKKSTEARDAQDQANVVESLIAKLDKPKDTLTLSPNVEKFMKDKKIMVDGMPIDIFLSGKKDQKLDKGDLMSIKSALESVSGHASDFNQQSQLKLQQVMQNYSTSSQLMQSVQSMLAEMTKGTAAAIR